MAWLTTAFMFSFEYNCAFAIFKNHLIALHISAFPNQRSRQHSNLQGTSGLGYSPDPSLMGLGLGSRLNGVRSDVQTDKETVDTEFQDSVIYSAAIAVNL